MFNIEIRNAIKKARIYNYEVAAALGIHECTFSKKIARKEFTEDEKNRVLKVVETLIERKC